MKAAILETLHAPLVVAEVQASAPGYGQVLVDVLASGLCGAQLQEIEGLKGNAHYVPHLLGHEGCGVVRECGPGVTEVEPGQRVVLHWRQGEGIESAPPTYLWGRRRITSGRVITLAEQALVSENRVTVVPDDAPVELCALLGCGLSTALGTIEQEARVLMGESVLILGCGGLGLNLILAARLVQAFPIYVLDRFESKRASALAMGAQEFLTPDRVADVRGPFDVIIDTTGAPEVIAWALPFLSGCGRFIMVGQPRPEATVELRGARHLFEGEGKMIKATQGGGFQPSADIPRYIQLWRSGALAGLSQLITHRMSLDQINDAVALVRAGGAGRVLVEMI